MAQSQDDAFHEIQLNGKQLVFLFMAATVVSVVIFLCGVLVGRGVRSDREALPLLLTLSSGVQGMTTIHAGSARQALTRLRFICQLSDTASEIPLGALDGNLRPRHRDAAFRECGGYRNREHGSYASSDDPSLPAAESAAARIT